MSINSITWVHLSDLHFRASVLHTWDQDIVTKNLLDDLEKQISDSDLKPDFILVSGDIAFSGHPSEYETAVDHVKHKTNAQRLVRSFDENREESLAQIDLIDILNSAWYSRMLSIQTEEMSLIKEFYGNLVT